MHGSICNSRLNVWAQIRCHYEGQRAVGTLVSSQEAEHLTNTNRAALVKKQRMRFRVNEILDRPPESLCSCRMSANDKKAKLRVHPYTT
jgi:hypothetical protein